MGAQWVHGEQGNALHSLAREYDMLPEKGQEFSVSDEEARYLWEDGREVCPALVTELQAVFASIEERLEREQDVGQRFQSQVRIHSEEEITRSLGRFLFTFLASGAG